MAIFYSFTKILKHLVVWDFFCIFASRIKIIVIMKKTYLLFLAFLLPVVFCAHTAYATELKWYMITDNGFSFEMKDVKMLSASNGKPTFEIIGNDGAVLAANVGIVKFCQAMSAPLLGDVNGDGKVNAADIIHTNNMIAGISAEGYSATNADVNFDDAVDDADVTGIKDLILSENEAIGNHPEDQVGGRGRFVAAFQVNEEMDYVRTKGIVFVHDEATGQCAWQPIENEWTDYASIDESYNIRHLKAIARYMESNNQITVGIPEEAPVKQNDIIVKAYGEELAPSEDYHYTTGANTITVTNSEGKTIYDCYASLDTLNHDRTIEINALETAYTLLIPLFPFALEPASDEILNRLKSLLAELPETHALAEAIDRSIVKNGYMDMDDIDVEFQAAVDRIIEKLGLRDNYMKPSTESQSRGNTRGAPFVKNPRGLYGMKLDMDDFAWTTSDDGKNSWKCKFTAYNSNRFAYTGWTKGYRDEEGKAHLPDKFDYTVLSKRILKPQRVSTFMDTFTSWDGMKDYFGDTYKLLFNDDFGFADMTWDNTKKSFDMTFSNSNEIVVMLGPADNEVMQYYNIVRAFFDPVIKTIAKGAIDPDEDDFFLDFCIDLISDTDYHIGFVSIIASDKSYAEKSKEFFKLTWPKLKKYLEERIKYQAKTKALQEVWDHWGFMRAGELDKALKDIDDNWNKWLKAVERWGDLFLSVLALSEGNYCYDLSLDFQAPEPAPTETFTVNGVKFKMVFVKGGSSKIGAMEKDKDASSWEKPRHDASFSDFAIGQTEVTQGLWQAVMGSNPSKFSGTELPVEQVSWNDCQEFIRKLSELTGRSFRLPTEAEWEYAARGGQSSRGYKYAGSNKLDDVAWHKGNSNKKTHPVNWKKPNELGIYDMSGNVLEWCQDYYSSSYYEIAPVTNPCNDTQDMSRVSRGGCFTYDGKYCRVSARSNFWATTSAEVIGLRLASSEFKETKEELPNIPADAIDLGLPSGTKWASWNVGATKPEEFGGYYAWGETKEKSEYSMATYEHGDGKYCNYMRNICGTQNDVAHVKWGGHWRMPSRSQFKELTDICSQEITTLNGVKGVKFTGPNGNSIFMPAAGERFGTQSDGQNEYGDYFSGSQHCGYVDNSSGYNSYAYGFCFGYEGTGYEKRWNGHSVRPVYYRVDEESELVRIYNDTNGSSWTHNDNWCSDQLLSDWYGVEVNSEYRVTRLSLSDNNLKGDFSIRNFVSLETLDLGGNQLSSLVIENCPELDLGYSFRLNDITLDYLEINNCLCGFGQHSLRGSNIKKMLFTNLENCGRIFLDGNVSDEVVLKDCVFPGQGVHVGEYIDVDQGDVVVESQIKTMTVENCVIGSGGLGGGVDDLIIKDSNIGDWWVIGAKKSITITNTLIEGHLVDISGTPEEVSKYVSSLIN